MSDHHQNKTAEIDFFEKFGERGGYERFHEESYHKLFNLFDTLVKPREGESLVDLGCGTGAFTDRLHQKYPTLQLLGIDICAKNIAAANHHYASIRFQSGDAEDTKIPSASVDIVCLFGLLHHFPEFDDVAKETHRILKPGGRYFALDPHTYNPAFWLFRSRSSPLYNSAGVTANERLLTCAESIDVFGKAGFQARALAMSGLKFCSVESRFLKTFLGAYNAFDQALSYTPLQRIIGPWVISWGVKE